MSEPEFAIEQLREWRASLDNVTLGPWRVAGKGTLRAGYGWIGSVHWRNRDPNAAHIARCDPQTIAALIDEVLEKRQFFTGYEAKAARIRNAALDEAEQELDRHNPLILGDDERWLIAKLRAAITALKTPEREDG